MDHFIRMFVSANIKNTKNKKQKCRNTKNTLQIVIDAVFSRCYSQSIHNDRLWLAVTDEEYGEL